MLSSSLRLLILAAVMMLSGCSTAPVWPKPVNTTDIVLQNDRREVLTTVTLGDALHLVLPTPSQPGLVWQILVMNTIALRQMTDFKPIPGRPGSAEISFQAIKTTARTLLRFAALDPKATTTTPVDFFAVTVGIKAPTRPLTNPAR